LQTLTFTLMYSLYWSAI